MWARARSRLYSPAGRPGAGGASPFRTGVDTAGRHAQQISRARFAATRQRVSGAKPAAARAAVAPSDAGEPGGNRSRIACQLSSAVHRPPTECQQLRINTSPGAGQQPPSVQWPDRLCGRRCSDSKVIAAARSQLDSRFPDRAVVANC